MIVSASDILAARILIVDDKEANVSLLTQLLAETGYTHVTATTNPLEVCILHRQHCYDLILLDLQMPGMDGFEVMQGLSAEETTGYLPVLVITAEPGHKLRALQSGAKDFISKPFDVTEVRTRIYNMLEVRLLYKKIEQDNQILEQTVAARTAELRESETRFRRLTELASDWYWEQDENGEFITVSGPVMDMLGIQANPFSSNADGLKADGWNEAERNFLRSSIAARQPFIDFIFSRTNSDGSRQTFRVSGEPMFNPSCRFVGYRGIGVELVTHKTFAIADALSA